MNWKLEVVGSGIFIVDASGDYVKTIAEFSCREDADLFLKAVAAVRAFRRDPLYWADSPLLCDALNQAAALLPENRREET